MGPWSVLDYYNAWKESMDKVQSNFRGALDTMTEWVKTDAFDWSIFLLSKRAQEGLPEVGVYGNAKAWSATYPRTDKNAEVSHIVMSFEKNFVVVRISLLYGDDVVAEVPYEAVDSFDSFVAWYNKAYAQAKSNREAVAKREEAKQERLKSHFAKWLEQGKDFIDEHLVTVNVDDVYYK